ncbi:MAG: hypothetical protein Unbinned2301contig1004_36 [Prokaryotic dsDNA virus sp.]|nr:MAG: hypothetical protein Unbinned2301contig1004_36 [Prokaryotic dsDNA virus sp.]|tara:strand:+ start:11435 stop:11833 length:399 start_codon:yes stop_codon:yes gene_type:complete
MTTATRRPIHVGYELSLTDLPREAIEDCSGPGSADAAVQHWVEELQFSVDQDAARECLKGYGAWDDLTADDLGDDETLADDETITHRVFWLACCNFSEYLFEASEAGFDPYSDETPASFEPSCGSDVYVLER